jgi:uncharacterized protein
MTTDFTPLSAAIGGALIGLAATLLYAGIGRIAGISGILNSSIEQRTERGWQLVFLLTMVSCAGLWLALNGPPPRNGFPTGDVIFAGVLVGFGTRLGNGCTSGHGICGLARLSARSLVAVATFMTAGFITVFVLRHLMSAVA